MQNEELVCKWTDSGSVVVATPESMEQIEADLPMPGHSLSEKPLQIRREILLEHAHAAKVISVLQEQYANVEFIPHPTMNGFYALGSRGDILAIKNDIPNLDRVSPEPSPVPGEFVQVNYGDLEELRSLLDTLVPDVQMNVDTRQSTLILEGSPEAIEQAKELNEQLDKPLDQVIVECRVLKLTEAGQKNLVVAWQPATLAGLTCKETIRLPGSCGEVPSKSSPASVRIGRMIRPRPTQAQLDQILPSGDARVLASPRIAAQDGVPGEIHLGDKFPVVAFDPGTGDFRVGSTDVGVKVNCTPTIHGDKVDCHLVVEVSTLLELVNHQYPRASVRTFSCDVTTKDGETVLLDGLFREEDLAVAETIPLLADLPIMGHLFRSPQGHPMIALTPQVMK